MVLATLIVGLSLVGIFMPKVPSSCRSYVPTEKTDGRCDASAPLTIVSGVAVCLCPGEPLPVLESKP